jgi:pimeloyl-ACP methyl ester carboxylesterase
MLLSNRNAMLWGCLAGALAACGSGDGPAKKKTIDPAMNEPDEVGDAGADAAESANQPHPGDNDPSVLPIVFVHGFAGSASQFDSQAQRFVANGYPPNKLRAYDHDGTSFDIEGFAAGLDAIIDAALAEFETEQVYLIGHSRGTFVANTYLGDAERAKKVAKVILLDGQPCTDVVPCDAPNQAELPGQKHVEVATSVESFARQYEFLFGEAPKEVAIIKQDTPVEISGRAVVFPANTGREGATLSIYELADATGARVSEEQLATYSLDAEGAWGPVTVDPDKHYEFALSSSESDVTQHFYFQPFLRSTKFVRLLSGGADAPSRVNSNLGPDHAALTVLRMREWTSADMLRAEATSESGGATSEDNVLTPAVTLMDNRIALYLHDDAATPKMSALAPLPYFPEQAFQTGADLYLPAAEPVDGTITLTSLPRGDKKKPQVLSFPNWPSDKHTIMVMFSDFPR